MKAWFGAWLLMAAWGASLSAGELKVAVSINPQAFLVKRIAGPETVVNVLVPDGKSPHDYSPTPVQVKEIMGSDVYLTLGNMPFEKRLAEKLKGHSRAGFAAVSAGIEFIPAQEKCESHDGHAHHDGNETGDDPHIWLDPVNLKIMAANITSALSKVAPERAGVFQANCRELTAELEHVDHRIAERLAPFKGRTVYVYHPAFGYFCRHYGLVQKAIEEEGKDPTPKQILGIISAARRDKVKVILVQKQFDSRSAARIAAAIGGRVVPLDILEYKVVGMLENLGNEIAAGLAGKATAVK